MRYIPESDYFIRYVDLPLHIGGCTVMNSDGTFSIYINARLPVEKQWSAFKHELVHIMDDHFYRDDLTTEEKERIAEEEFERIINR